MQAVLDRAKEGKAWLTGALKNYSGLEKFFLLCFCFLFLGYFCFSATMQRNFIYLPAPFLAFYLWRTKERAVYESTPWLWISLALFWGYNLASVFWSQNAGAALFIDNLRYELMDILFTCGLATLVFRHPESWNFLCRTFLYAALISGIVLFIDRGLHTALTHSPLLRLGGFGRCKNPNICAALYAVAAIFLLYAPVSGDRIAGNRIVRGFALVLFLTLVVWTMGRGPLLALLITFLALAVLQGHYRRLSIILGVYAAVAAFVVWNPADWGDIMKRGDDNRFVIWRQAAGLAKSDPMFGIGIGTELKFPVPGMTEVFNSTHNLFLGAFVYGGAVGLVLLLLAYGSMVFYGFRQSLRSQDKSVIALIVFGTVFFMFETHKLILNVNPEWLFFYVPIAVMAGFLARSRVGLRAGSPGTSIDA